MDVDSSLVVMGGRFLSDYPVVLASTRHRTCLCYGRLAGYQAASHKAEFCILCHNMQPEYDSYTKGNLLAKKHNDANVTCHDCHTPTIGEQLNEVRMYATGDLETPTKQRGFTNEQCTSCHKIADIRKKTAHYGLSNPHEGTHNKDNEMLQCQSCHAVHHPQKLNTCMSCMSCHPIDWKVDSSWKMYPPTKK